MLLVQVGQVLLLAGRVSSALAQGRRALDLALGHEAKGDEAWARFLIARAIWADRPRDLHGCAQELRASSRLATLCDQRPLVAFCGSSLSAVQSAAGDRVQAEHSMNAAAALYRELDLRALPTDPITSRPG
jgi:hypothetical protein